MVKVIAIASFMIVSGCTTIDHTLDKKRTVLEVRCSGDIRAYIGTDIESLVIPTCKHLEIRPSKGLGIGVTIIGDIK